MDDDEGVGDEDGRFRSLASEVGGLNKGGWKWCGEDGEEEGE